MYSSPVSAKHSTVWTPHRKSSWQSLLLGHYSLKLVQGGLETIVFLREQQRAGGISSSPEGSGDSKWHWGVSWACPVTGEWLRQLEGAQEWQTGKACNQLRLPALWIRAGNVCGMSALQGRTISQQAKVQFTSHFCKFDLCDHAQCAILHSLCLSAWSSGSKYGF